MSNDNEIAPIGDITGRVLFYLAAAAFSVGILFTSGRLVLEAIRVWVTP